MSIMVAVMERKLYGSSKRSITPVDSTAYFTQCAMVPLEVILVRNAAHLLVLPIPPNVSPVLTSPHTASDSTLSKLLEESLSLQPDERAKILEDNEEVESAYATVARQGDSEVPENPEDEVDFHYVCFVRSPKSGHIYELDGDRKGPIDRGKFEGAEDMLSEGCLNLVRDFITKEKDNLNFSLMALVSNE
jgi:hypothetical protein